MFDLTKQERQAVLFLMAISLAGAGLEFLVKHVPPLERRRCLDSLGKIDLNTADRDALKSLPGIGEKLAQRIIDYREENQGFSDLEELARVKGVRPELATRLKEHLFVR